MKRARKCGAQDRATRRATAKEGLSSARRRTRKRNLSQGQMRLPALNSGYEIWNPSNEALATILPAPPARGADQPS